MEKNSSTLLSSLLVLLAINGYCQQIDEIIVDDFSGDTTITTTWEPLTAPLVPDSFVRIRKLNQGYYLDFKIIQRSVFTVYQNQKFTLLTADQEAIEFNIAETKISCIGCGAKGLKGFKQLGMELSFLISDETLSLLQSKNITKFRLETKEGKVDKEVPKKFQSVIPSSIELVYRK